MRPEVLDQLQRAFEGSNWTESFVNRDSRRKDTLHHFAREGRLIYLGVSTREGLFILGDPESHVFAPTMKTLELLVDTSPRTEWREFVPFQEFRASFVRAPDETSRRYIQAQWEEWHLLQRRHPLPPALSFSYLLETCPSAL